MGLTESAARPEASVADVEACFGCWLMVWEHPVDGNLYVTIAKPHQAKVASGWHESRPDEVDEWHYSRAFRREPVEEMAHHICDMWNAETVPDYEPAPD